MPQHQADQHGLAFQRYSASRARPKMTAVGSLVIALLLSFPRYHSTVNMEDRDDWNETRYRDRTPSVAR